MVKLVDMVGRGKISISDAADLAHSVAPRLQRANSNSSASAGAPMHAKAADNPETPCAAIRAFASLGADTKCPQNVERDLHRWLRGLYNFRLQPYKIHLNLQAPRLHFKAS